MNMKIVLLFLLTFVILAGAPVSLAKPQYFASLNTVYGTGSCDTCHVNGNSDETRTSYGILFENQANHAANPDATLKTIGAPPTATQTFTPTAALTPAVTATSTPTPAVTTVTATGTPKTPGFGFGLSIIGLFVCFLLANKT